MTSVAWLGTMFLNALKMLIVPLVFTSMVTGIAGLGDIRNFGKLGKKTVLYYLSTTMIAVTIGIILVNIIQPGAGVQPLTSDIPDRVQNKSDFQLCSSLSWFIPSKHIPGHGKYGPASCHYFCLGFWWSS